MGIKANIFHFPKLEKENQLAASKRSSSKTPSHLKF